MLLMLRLRMDTGHGAWPESEARWHRPDTWA